MEKEKTKRNFDGLKSVGALIVVLLILFGVTQLHEKHMEEHDEKVKEEVYEEIFAEGYEMGWNDCAFEFDDYLSFGGDYPEYNGVP